MRGAGAMSRILPMVFLVYTCAGQFLRGPRHPYELKSWSPPKSQRPSHWDENLWPNMDHEKLLEVARQKEEQRIAAAKQEAAAHAARRLLHSPQQFMSLLRSAQAGDYSLLLR